MRLSFDVSDQTGQAGQVTDQDVMNQIRGVGYNPMGISADGLTMTMQDPHGQYDVKTSDVLKSMGWQINDMKPMNPVYDTVQPEWRAAVSALPDDLTKKAYIQGRMERAGAQGTQVIGSGRDWYVFNPNTSSWLAVTNSPDWEMGDLAEAGVEAPSLLASAAGGTVGGLAGGPTPAAIAGAAVGAGLAGGAADAGTRALLAMRDPTLKRVMTENMGAIGQDVLKGAAFDALGGGGATALTKLGSPLLKSFGQSGAVSQLLKTGGGAAEGAGGLTSRAAGFAADTPLVRDTASMFIPGIGDASAAGFLAQAPEYLATKGAAGIGGLGETGVARGLLGEENALQAISKDLLRPRAAGTPAFAEEVAARLGGAPATRTTAADVGGNLGEMVGAKFVDKSKYLPERMDATRAGYQMARSFGIPAKDALGLGRQSADDLIRQLARKQVSQTWGTAGESVGRGVSALGNVGRGLEQTATGITSMGLRGIQGLGKMTQGAGYGAKTLGTLSGPLESRALLSKGTEEGYNRYFRKPVEDDILDYETYLAGR